METLSTEILAKLRTALFLTEQFGEGNPSAMAMAALCMGYAIGAEQPYHEAMNVDDQLMNYLEREEKKETKDVI